MDSFCDPVWIRTKDLLLRRQLLYPAELADLNFNTQCNIWQLLPPRRTELRDQYFYPAACLPKNSEGRSYGTYKKKGDDCSSPVGAAGFEPATSWSQTRRDDRTTLRPELLITNTSISFSAHFSWSPLHRCEASARTLRFLIPLILHFVAVGAGLPAVVSASPL